MAKSSWGLDISKSSFKAVKIQWLKDKPTITEIDILPYTLSATQDEAALEQEIRNALSTFIKQHKVRGDSVVVSLPTHTAFNRFIKVPPVAPEERDSLIQSQAQQHLPFPINEAIWTYQLIERDYQPGEELDIVLFALKKELIDQFFAILNAVGFHVDIIQFAPVALYNFITYDQELDKYTVVLDMGAQNTDLILLEGEKFWIRNLPVVGNDLSKAVQKKFDIPFAEAEQMKQTPRGAQQAGKVFNTIQPVLKELVSEIHRSIGYYKSLSSGGEPINFERIVIAGNASKVIYFPEFISQRLQLEPVRISQLTNIEWSERLDKALWQEQLPSLGVALGLALQGLEVTKNKINLLPQEAVRKKEITRKKPWFVAIAASIILILGLLHFSAKEQYDKLASKSQQISQLIQKCDDIEKRYKKVQQTKDLEDQLKNFVNIPDQNIWLKIFQAFNKIEGLKLEGLDNKKGYIETNNAEDVNSLKRVEDSRIWILSIKVAREYQKIKGGGKEETQMGPPVINLSLICGIVCRRTPDETPDPIGSQEFVKKNLVKPLVDEFKLPEVAPLPVDLENPVTDLKSPDEEKTVDKGTEPKYYRYRVELQIPVE
jgi:type IV pilus assembly protein PilM